MPTITLIGYRGTGKSTVAAALAGRLGCAWRDADRVLEEHLGCSITTLVRERGEAAFRQEEAAVLDRLLLGFDGIVATGGGVVLKAANRERLKASGRPIAWLTASAEVIRERLAADPTTRDSRPALTGDDPLAEVDAALAARETLYRECADAAFNTAVFSAEDIAGRIAAWLDERSAGPGVGA